MTRFCPIIVHSSKLYFVAIVTHRKYFKKSSFFIVSFAASWGYSYVILELVPKSYYCGSSQLGPRPNLSILVFPALPKTRTSAKVLLTNFSSEKKSSFFFLVILEAYKNRANFLLLASCYCWCCIYVFVWFRSDGWEAERIVLLSRIPCLAEPATGFNTRFGRSVAIQRTAVVVR